MKLNDFTIAAARPNNMRPDNQFTERVMRRTAKKQPKQLFMLLRQRPAFMALAIVLGLALLSGTAYAVSYLWPQLHPDVTAPHQSTSGRTSVIVTDCDKVDSTKRYELKKGAPVSPDKLAEIVKAKCELAAVSNWATSSYPSPHDPAEPNNTPGATRTHTTITPALFAVQLATQNNGVMTVKDSGSLEEYELPFSADTKVVVDGQYSVLAKLAPGDAIAYVSKDTTVTKNQANCIENQCHADIASSTRSTLAVIKLSHRFDVYRAISYLSELPVCPGNPADECPDTSSVDLFQGGGIGEDAAYAELSGKVMAYDDQSITLRTTSGRQVTVYTPWNLIGRFNTQRSSDYGFTIGEGDTLTVGYGQVTGKSNDTEVPFERLVWINVLMEANSKGGPYHKY